MPFDLQSPNAIGGSGRTDEISIPPRSRKFLRIVSFLEMKQSFGPVNGSVRVAVNSPRVQSTRLWAAKKVRTAMLTT
jgi:hypothetical protein